MGGKITEDIMPNEIKKPLDKFANKFGDMFIPKELAKPLMMAAPFLGPLGPIAAAAGSAKEHGGIDYDLVAMTMAANAQQPSGGQASTAPRRPPGAVARGTSALGPQNPSFMQNLGQGTSNAFYNTRDFLLGNPTDRSLLSGSWQNPFAGGGQSPITGVGWDPGSSWTNMFNNQSGIFSNNADWDLIKEGAKDVGAAGSAQTGMMVQKDVIEDYKKQKERDEAENRGFWQNYFAGMTRNRPYEEGRMGAEMDQLYAQYGAADEYDPYYGMQDAYAGTYFDEDRWYGKKGGRIGLQGGGGPHRDIAPRPRRAGLESMLRKLSRMKDAVNDERRARVRERARMPGGIKKERKPPKSIEDYALIDNSVMDPEKERLLLESFGYDPKHLSKYGTPNNSVMAPDPISKSDRFDTRGQRVELALGGNDEVGGLSSLTSQVPKNVPGVPNGMQIDARQPGGTYIDAGTKPKADDVAAMLSEGEFVITKDGMEGFDLQTGGPGDSRSGAKKMYAQMNEWETVAAQAGV